MVVMRTQIALFLIFVIVTSGLIMLETAQTQTSPSVPQFTLKIEKDLVPNTTRQVEFVDVVIQNPAPYSYYAVVNDTIVKLYYNIRFKAQSANWVDTNLSTTNLAPSTTTTTTVKFGVGTVNPDPGGWSIWLGSSLISGQVDFQVRGVYGYYTNTTSETPPCWRLPQYSVFHEVGASAWSQTQIIAIPSG
jgi:hypothetical protein